MVRIILLRIWVATIRLGIIIPHRIVRILIIGLISRRWGRRCGSLAGSVLLHRKLKSHLVFSCHPFKHFLIIRSQCAPTFSKHLPKLHKFNAWKFREYFRTHRIREEYVSPTCALGGIWILRRALGSFPGTLIFNEHTASIVSRGRQTQQAPPRSELCLVGHVHPTLLSHPL